MRLILHAGARALNVAGASLAFFFHHDGMGPQRMETSAFPPSWRITVLMMAVGQML
jgi:hypothetical protein